MENVALQPKDSGLRAQSGLPTNHAELANSG